MNYSENDNESEDDSFDSSSEYSIESEDDSLPNISFEEFLTNGLKSFDYIIKNFKTFAYFYLTNQFSIKHKNIFFLKSLLYEAIQIFDLLIYDTEIDFKTIFYPLLVIDSSLIKKAIELNKIDCDLYFNCLKNKKNLKKLLFKHLKNEENKKTFLPELQEELLLIKDYDKILYQFNKDIKYQIITLYDEYYRTDSEIYSLLE